MVLNKVSTLEKLLPICIRRYEQNAGRLERAQMLISNTMDKLWNAV